ncbi:MAG: hypothetical protein FGM46_04135 [Ferruginibacter sp.]|nr:hypothetical protein [Ferruginibacter sp.]
MTLIVSIVVFILLIVLILIGFLFAFSRAAAPSDPVDSANELKRFLGLDFGNNYSIVEQSSRNYHPDRPMNVTVSLSESDFEKVIEYLTTLNFETSTSFSKDNKIRYTEYWRKYGEEYRKNYTAARINESGSDYPFFNADLYVDINTRCISYNEFGI